MLKETVSAVKTMNYGNLHCFTVIDIFLYSSGGSSNYHVGRNIMSLWCVELSELTIITHVKQLMTNFKHLISKIDKYLPLSRALCWVFINRQL